MLSSGTPGGEELLSDVSRETVSLEEAGAEELCCEEESCFFVLVQADSSIAADSANANAAEAVTAVFLFFIPILPFSFRS